MLAVQTMSTKGQSISSDTTKMSSHSWMYEELDRLLAGTFQPTLRSTYSIFNAVKVASSKFHRRKRNLTRSVPSVHLAIYRQEFESTVDKWLHSDRDSLSHLVCSWYVGLEPFLRERSDHFSTATSWGDNPLGWPSWGMSLHEVTCRNLWNGLYNAIFLYGQLFLRPTSLIWLYYPYKHGKL